jgi:hypothetical protein
MMRRWASIDELGNSCALVEPERVLDGGIGAGRPPMREDVGTDLCQSDLESHEVAVVLATASRLSQPLNRLMKRLQSGIEMTEGCMELKGLRRGAHGQKPVRASSTVAK